jgi:hypothetical protein
MSWLPDGIVESETAAFEKSDDFRCLTAGGFSLFEVARGDRGFVAGRNGLEALEVGGDRVVWPWS